MAVPSTLALPNFNGTFTQNNLKSDPQDKIQGLQGVPFALRKVFGMAKVKLNMIVEPINAADSNAKHRFIINSEILGLGPVGAAPLRAVGFQTKNTDERVLDGSEMEKTEPIIGTTKSRVWLSTLDELLNSAAEGTKKDGTGAKFNVQTDEFLKQGWEGNAAGTTYVIRMSILGGKDGADSWRNEQVWGVQQGQWTGRVAFTKGAVKETARLVYDFES